MLATIGMNPTGASLLADVDGTDAPVFSLCGAVPGAETPGVVVGDETAGSAALLGVTVVPEVPEVLEGRSGTLITDGAEAG
jgi:hypothetical protein